MDTRVNIYYKDGKILDSVKDGIILELKDFVIVSSFVKGEFEKVYEFKNCDCVISKEVDNGEIVEKIVITR